MTSYGEYLLGTGPSTVGIIPLNAHAIVLGRPPAFLEGPFESAVDYRAVDTLYFVPREVSRLHAKAVRQTGDAGTRHLVIDLNSTCGTAVNGRPVDLNDPGIVLRHGDVISLGPSQTSTYIYHKAARLRPASGGNKDSSAARIWLAEPQ